MKKLTSKKQKLSFPEPGSKEWICYALKNMKWSTAKSMFLLLAGINRPIKPSQVTVISNSMTKMMMIRAVVVAYIDFLPGAKGYYIIDGQHLCFACIRLDINIPYVEVPIANKQELVEAIALFNATSKNWTMQDYVTAWSNLHPDYIKLNSYFNQYDFELNILAGVLGNTELSGTTTKIIKTGNFKIKNENQGKAILDSLTDLFKVLNRGSRYEIKYLCSEFVKFYRTSKNYNHTKFMNNVKKNKPKLDLVSLESGKLVKVFQTFVE